MGGFPIENVMTFLDEFMQKQQELQAVQQQREMFEKLGLGEFLPEQPTSTMGKVGQVLRGGPTPIAGGDVGGMLAKGKIGQMYPSPMDELYQQLFMSRMGEGGGLSLGAGAAGTEEIPEGYEKVREPMKKAGVVIGYQDVLKKKTLSATEQWRIDLNKYRNEEISADELVNLYPEKEKTIGEMERKRGALGKPPLQKAQGFWQRKKKEVAAIDQPTADYAKTIRTVGDLERFLQEIPTLKAKGVNVDALLKYYQEIGLIEPK